MLKLILWMCYVHLSETRAQRGYGVWRVYGDLHSVFIYYYNFKNYILLYFLSGLYIPPITT